MTALIADQGFVGECERKGESRQRKPGDGTQAADGETSADEPSEQLLAEQLLQDPALTDMWLRQIQRDPSEFLTTKFCCSLSKLKKQKTNDAATIVL